MRHANAWLLQRNAKRPENRPSFFTRMKQARQRSRRAARPSRARQGYRLSAVTRPRAGRVRR